MEDELTRWRSKIRLAGEMRRMLALGWAGGSSFVDLKDDRRLEDCTLGEAPLMAASKNSRSLRLHICVVVLTVVKR